MSETKFTKGEWDACGNCVTSITASSVIALGQAGDAAVKYYDCGLVSEDEAAANANLIAAAPEMYEEIESEIEFLRELRSEAHTPYMAELFDNRIADKVNLLAKARGEK